MRRSLLLVISIFACIGTQYARGSGDDGRDIVIAILAKNKAELLPAYLDCIEWQTVDPSRIHIYIRTNNNTDTTAEVLKEWVDRVQQRYASVVLLDHDVPQRVERFKEHEWNSERFKVLGEIRQASLRYALEKGAHYFVVDCDNFIRPSTLEDLLQSAKSVVAPVLYSGSQYSNFHHCVNEWGYHTVCDHYKKILYREDPGFHECAVVHCTYFIRHEILDKMAYIDGSENYEYVIFSNNCRKLGIPQYLDTRKQYGILTLLDSDDCDMDDLIDYYMMIVSE